MVLSPLEGSLLRISYSISYCEGLDLQLVWHWMLVSVALVTFDMVGQG